MITGDGQAVTVFAPGPEGIPTLTTYDASGAQVRKAAVPEAAFGGSIEGRSTAVKVNPAAVGLIRGAIVIWQPLGDPSAPPITAIQVSFGGTGDGLISATRDPGEPPRQVLSVTAAGLIRWRLDLAEGVVTSMAKGPGGSAAVGAYSPGPQPRAWVTIVSPDGTVQGRYETGSEPLYRLAVGGDGPVAALDNSHVWLIDPKAGTTRVMTVQAPQGAAFGAKGALGVVNQDGLVTSITPEAQVNWRRQLAGPATDLAVLPDGGLVVLGEDRLYWLDDAGRARRTIAFPDRPRQVTILSNEGQLVVLAGGRVSAYPLSPYP
jgi:hypothetical protein